MLFNSNNFFNQNKTSNENKMYEYEILSFPNKKSNFGSFKGNYPKQAAEKAFTFLSNLVGDEIKEDGNFVVFSIRKKTKNNINSNKSHKFIGTVIELENNVYNRNLKKTVKFKNVLSKYNNDLDKINSTNKNIKYKI